MKRYSSLVLFILLIISSIACSRRQGSAVASKSTLRVNTHQISKQMDWTGYFDVNSDILFDNVMSGLFTYEMKNGEIHAKPDLVESYKTVDSLSWTFKLKKGVLWSDGKPLIAKHFIDSWQRSLDPKRAATGRELISDFTDFKALGDLEIQLTLKRKMPHLPLILAHPASFPFRLDEIDPKTRSYQLKKNSAVLGPYKVKSSEGERKIVLTKNDRYHGRSPQIEEVELTFFESESTASRLLQTGLLDVNRMVLEHETRNIEHWDVLRVAYLALNTTHGLFQNRDLRRYLSASIDRGEMLRYLKIPAKPQKQFAPLALYSDAVRENIKAFSLDPTSPQYTPKQAVELLVPNGSRQEIIATWLKSHLEKKMDIKVEISMLPWKLLNARVEARDFDIAYFGWNADYPHPENFLKILKSDSENNKPGWKSKEYDTLFDKLGDKNQAEILLQMERKIFEEAPIVPLFQGAAAVQVSDRLNGLKPHLLKKIYFKDLSFR